MTAGRDRRRDVRCARRRVRARGQAAPRGPAATRPRAPRGLGGAGPAGVATGRASGPRGPGHVSWERRRPRIAAIGLTGQCPSVCLVDAHGRPVSAGLIYRDNRATAEAAAIRERFGDAAIHARTGHLPSAFHIAPKLLWLKGHEPAAFDRASRALQPRDLVAHALTGEMATDGTHAAATLVFDLRQRAWATVCRGRRAQPRTLSARAPIGRAGGGASGVDRPARRRAGGRAGHPRRRGLPGLRAGRGRRGRRPGQRDGRLVDLPECLRAEPLPILQVTHYPHVVPGPYTTETGINTTGAAVAWVADLLYAPRGRRAGAPTTNGSIRGGRRRSPEPMASLALPVLADGERTDPDLRGAFTGLSLRHGRAVHRPRDDGGRGLRHPRAAGPHPRGWGTGDRAARIGR